MKHLVIAAILAATIGCASADNIAGPVSNDLTPPSAVASAYDTYGYNDIANSFNGIADGVYKTLGDGDMGIFALDHLLMKWNQAWVNCNAARSTGATQPQLAVICADAWTRNDWNGQMPGGSGDVWHYKIQYIGPCGSTGTPLVDGGYCIWNEYEVVFSQGTSANQHFWEAHAKPAGFGV